jgi:hypothetical protein
MSALAATFAKCTLTAAAPFAAVYFWPKQSHEVLYYIPKNAPNPLLSLPRTSSVLPAVKAPQTGKMLELL